MILGATFSKVKIECVLNISHVTFLIIIYNLHSSLLLSHNTGLMIKLITYTNIQLQMDCILS